MRRDFITRQCVSEWSLKRAVCYSTGYDHILWFSWWRLDARARARGTTTVYMAPGYAALVNGDERNAPRHIVRRALACPRSNKNVLWKQCTERCYWVHRHGGIGMALQSQLVSDAGCGIAATEPEYKLADITGKAPAVNRRRATRAVALFRRARPRQYTCSSGCLSRRRRSLAAPRATEAASKSRSDFFSLRCHLRC